MQINILCPDLQLLNLFGDFESLVFPRFQLDTFQEIVKWSHSMDDVDPTWLNFALLQWKV